MDVFMVLSLLGGLALFLYGMNVMGTSLEKQSGGKFKAVLERLTASPGRSVLLGCLVTAAIQSSSATTVMVVGFVNSGIMKLNQAIGIIMGANIGTTVTAWLLSLAGIEGDSFLIQMLKPTSFSPLLAIIGIVLIMVCKSVKKKDVGTVLISFAILMFGMKMMSDAVAPLADIPEFGEVFTWFSNPLLGVLAGALLTAIVQSSSASVGILQALSITGTITYSAAIPIIMGQNIGTCVTALISSVGANKNARRAALVHLYFNLIGTTVFLALYVIVNYFVQFSFADDPVNVASIAVIHTIFNICCTAVLLPFTKQLEKLAIMTIKEDSKKETFQLLDERILAAPSVAVTQCRNLTNDMAKEAKYALQAAIRLTKEYNAEGAQKVLEAEEKIDRYEDKLGTYLVKISGNSLSLQDSHEVSKLLHSIGDFERIGDHSVNILETAQELYEKNIAFSEQALRELDVVALALDEILDLAVSAFVDNDLILAGSVEPLEQVVDDLKMELKRRHVERLRKGECTIELGFIFSDLLNNYERIADHCSNIAVCLIQVNRDSFDTHEYLQLLKQSEDRDFHILYENFAKKYRLP